MRMWTVSVASWLGLLLIVPSSGWGQGLPPIRTPPYSAASAWGPPAIGRLNSATPSYPELPTRVPSSLTGDTSRFASHSPQYLAEPVPDDALSSQLFGAAQARPPAKPPGRDG